MPQDKQFAWALYHEYDNYKEQTLLHRRFKYKNILPLVFKLKSTDKFNVVKAGESFERRDIYLLSIGNGEKKVFCWSQMHGDEPTATAALFDIFNFFADEHSFMEFKDYLLNTVTLYFMPMVNPDGAEVFQRRNMLEIDLNRDAEAKQSPEAKILYDTFDKLKPLFGFNLHDQERIYSAGTTKRNAALSFLAPPFDYEKTVNESRTNSMKLISELSDLLTEFIPGHIAKYKDDFEPRAFGDNFTKEGTSIVLIESGAWKDDRERQFIRKLNFISLLMAFKSIADESYLSEKIEIYNSIPYNEELMMDFIVRNVSMRKNGLKLKLDIGINFEEVNINNANDFYLKAKIEDIGDLSVFTGFQELDAKGLILHPGKTTEDVFNSLDELKNLNPLDLFQNNITNVKIKTDEPLPEFSPFPFNIMLNEREVTGNEIKVEAVPNFVLTKGGKFKYAVVNGFLYDAITLKKKEGNGLIIR